MLFTPKRSMCVIVCIFFFIVLTYVPIFYSHRLHWRQIPETNETKLVLVFTEDKEQIETICHFINDVIFPTICLTAVMLCTKITVSRINISKQWRKSMATTSNVTNAPHKICKSSNTQHQQQQIHSISMTSNNNDFTEELTCEIEVAGDDAFSKTTKSKSNPKHTSKSATSYLPKDKKVTRMISLICIIFLICNTPCILIIYLRFMVPEIANRGRYHNLFHIIYSLDFLLETFNSTINFVVYYNMSSRYKQEFHKLFCFKSND